MAASWSARARIARNRLAASERVQRWSLGNPIGRFFARRKARALFDLCAGFVYSQTLLGCVRAGLFELLAERELSAGEIAAAIDLDPEAARLLLDAAASVDLLAKHEERYGLSLLGASLLGNPGLAEMIEHNALLYADLADPLALLRGAPSEGALSRFWGYARAERPERLDGEAVSAYSALMAASNAMIARAALAAHDFSRYRKILDVGGGEGAFLRAVAAETDGPALALFDLPAVAERARAAMDRAGLGARFEAVGGDFHADPPPEGADLITLVRVLHDHDDRDVVRLLQRCRGALSPGGALLVIEPMRGAAGAEPIADAYFAFYLRAMGRGRPRSVEDVAAMAREAGFARAERIASPMPLLASMVRASA